MSFHFQAVSHVEAEQRDICRTRKKFKRLQPSKRAADYE